MAGSCSKAIGGVADVRSLALNEEVMKVTATNGYKKATDTKTPRTGRGVFTRMRPRVYAGLANTILTQGGRSEVAGGGGEAKVIRLLLFVLHAQCQIAAGLQVVEGFEGVPRHLLVVVVLGMCLGYTPQLATTVIVVDDRCLPGVLVDVEVTLGVDVALAFLQVATTCQTRRSS